MAAVHLSMPARACPVHARADPGSATAFPPSPAHSGPQPIIIIAKAMASKIDLQDGRSCPEIGCHTGSRHCTQAAATVQAQLTRPRKLRTNTLLLPELVTTMSLLMGRGGSCCSIRQPAGVAAELAPWPTDPSLALTIPVLSKLELELAVPLQGAIAWPLQPVGRLGRAGLACVCCSSTGHEQEQVEEWGCWRYHGAWANKSTLPDLAVWPRGGGGGSSFHQVVISCFLLPTRQRPCSGMMASVVDDNGAARPAAVFPPGSASARAPAPIPTATLEVALAKLRHSGLRHCRQWSRHRPLWPWVEQPPECITPAAEHWPP